MIAQVITVSVFALVISAVILLGLGMRESYSMPPD